VSFPDAITIITRIVTGAAGIGYHFVFTFVFAGIIALASVVGYQRNQGHGYYPLLDLSRFWPKVVLLFTILLMLMFFYAGDTAFIYFQF
jgi:TRAP-type C4-dicarboxylate transport system permease small subunit